MLMPDPAQFTLAAAPGLDAQEVQALLCGRRDAHRLNWDASLPQGRLRRAVRRLLQRVTGIEAATPFASDRLEALRLFACMMLRDDRRAGGAADRLLTLGFSPAALRQAIGIALG